MRGPSLPITKRASGHPDRPRGGRRGPRAPGGAAPPDVHPPPWNRVYAERAGCMQDPTSVSPSTSFHVAVTLCRAPWGPPGRPATPHELSVWTGRVWEPGRGAEGPRPWRRQPGVRAEPPPTPRRPLPGCWRLCRAGGRGLSPTLGCRVCGPLSTEPGGDRGHEGLARSGRGAGWHSPGVGLTVRPPAPLTGSSRSLQTGGRGGPSGAAVHHPSPRVPASSLRSSRPPKPRAQTRLPRVCRPALRLRPGSCGRGGDPQPVSHPGPAEHPLRLPRGAGPRDRTPHGPV